MLSASSVESSGLAVVCLCPNFASVGSGLPLVTFGICVASGCLVSAGASVDGCFGIVVGSGSVGDDVVDGALED